jgi:chromosome segregation ATPase
MAEKKLKEELDAQHDRHEKDTAALLEEERERFETRLNAERTQMTARMDLQMKELQEDSEKLVDSLEAAVEGLKKEKKALAEQLDTLSKKLEDTEDAHYDTEQQSKRRLKEQSIALWRAVANLQKMRNVYQEGLSELDKRHAKDEERLKKEMQSVTDKMVLRVMWLTHTVMELETARRKMYSILTTHKVCVLTHILPLVFCAVYSHSVFWSLIVTLM